MITEAQVKLAWDIYCSELGRCHHCDDPAEGMTHGDGVTKYTCSRCHDSEAIDFTYVERRPLSEDYRRCARLYRWAVKTIDLYLQLNT